MVTAVIDRTAPSVQGFRERTSRAAGLGPRDRAPLSVEVLARTEPVSHLAHRHQVSRQFLYRQAHTARAALDDAFAPATDEGEVLFHLPVTKTWLRQFVLAQVLIGHTSFRGVQEILEAVFDHDGLSLGTLHAILHRAVTTARTLNAAQSLTPVRVGAHDELFQAGQPVLVGADLRSTSCYLLAAEAHRDETTWGVHLLDLRDQGLRPDYTVADGGLGLRAGPRPARGPPAREAPRPLRPPPGRRPPSPRRAPRASSLVENLNRRLRNSFFLRRHLGNDYLELLRFFLNHRRFRRSERPERVDHRPTELLTGQSHAHWLELLGFQRFRRN